MAQLLEVRLEEPVAPAAAVDPGGAPAEVPNDPAELPDGAWYEHGYIDHDGSTDALYEIKVAMTKRGERLAFDFRGTSTQAPGMINCTYTGLWGGVMAAMLTLLCYDMPWATGALSGLVEIISEEGTVNNARHPAAVSAATVAATFMTFNVCMQAIAKMYACSERYRGELMATGWPGWIGANFSGLDQRGRYFTATMLDTGGGGGARSTRDGLDVEGTPGSPKMAMSNIETVERLYPLLYLYRKEQPATLGPGKYRGGAGLELGRLVHKAASPVRWVAVIQAMATTYPGATFVEMGPGNVLTGLLKRLDPAITLLVIEHDMDVAFALADRITVLHYGRVVADGLSQAVKSDPMVQEIYLGAIDA